MCGCVPANHNRSRDRILAVDNGGNWVPVSSMRVPWVNSEAGSSLVRAEVDGQHQQETFPSGQNGSIRVDTLRESRQSHPSGRLLAAQHHNDVSHCILPSDRSFAISSGSVGIPL